MSKTMKKLAVLLALTMLLNVTVFAGAESDVESVPTDVWFEQTDVDEGAEMDAGQAPDAPELASDEANEDVASDYNDETLTAPEEEPADETEELPEEAPAEPEDGEQEAESDEPTEPEVPAFMAKVHIELKNLAQLYYGDTVTLKAVVEEANAAYTVAWQFFNEEADLEKGEDPWVVCAAGEEYSFVVSEANATRVYRAVVNGEVVSGSYILPEVLVRVDDEVTPDEEPVEEPTEAPAAEPTQEPAEEPAEEPTEAPDAEPTQEPAEEPVPTLNPDRGIMIVADWGEGDLHFGDESVLTAILFGYDNAVYTLQWQTSKDNVNWVDVEGATEKSYTMTVTADNYMDYWRVVVTITDLML